MEIILSVAVPSYNAEWCLKRCLESFITNPVSNRLEVIVVNDGSTDGTLALINEYVSRYPGVFRLIDKENGGHGSGINAAARLARGKYFRVVDADDWIVTENLNPLLDIMANTTADAVITHFHTVDMKSGKRQAFQTRGIPLGQVYTLDEFTSYPGETYACRNIHGIAYRTQAYRESGVVLSEGIFYEDQEFATFPFIAVKTVLPLDMFFYQYMVGNVNQSVSDANQVKRLNQLEQVVRNIYLFYREHGGMAQGARRYISKVAVDMLPYYYIAAMIKNPDKPQGRRVAALFREELQAIEPTLVAKSDHKYKLAILLNRLRVTGKMVQKMRSPLPYALYRRLFKKNRRYSP